MKTIFSALALVALNAASAAAQTPTAVVSSLGLKTPNEIGCFSSAGDLVNQGTYIYQALGNCQPLCVEQGYPILAFFNGSYCFCGNSIPSASDMIPKSECNSPCEGYPSDVCGGPSAYLVYEDGLPYSGAVPSATGAGLSATSDSGKPDVVASTVYVTQPGSTSAQVIYTTEVAQSGGPNKAAIAAGVVVGILVLASIIGGFLLYLRRMKRKALAEDMRRQESITNFVTRGEKPPSTASQPDSRLEPSGFSRRMSDQSIADNIDYSRRILKVTNPDER